MYLAEITNHKTKANSAIISEVANAASFTAQAIILKKAALPSKSAAMFKYSNFILIEPNTIKKLASPKKAPKSPS